MKRQNTQILFDGMAKVASEKYPEKESAEAQFKAYGKMGLLIYCQKRGYGYNEYLDVLERVSA
jgi:hypothetical protein